MTGHLERRHNWVELVVVALLVFVIFSTTRLRPQAAIVDHAPADPAAAEPPAAAGPERGLRAGGQPARTPGGRLTLGAHAATSHAAAFDDDDAPLAFAVAAALSVVAIILGTLAAIQWWDDRHHYHPAYVLYGSLGLLWIVAPSIYAFGWGRDAPFPTLFRTVANLEDWLGSRATLGRFGPILAWLVAYLILTGLVILFIHLTLYPYPDITRILNPGG